MPYHHYHHLHPHYQRHIPRPVDPNRTKRLSPLFLFLFIIIGTFAFVLLVYLLR